MRNVGDHGEFAPGIEPTLTEECEHSTELDGLREELRERDAELDIAYRKIDGLTNQVTEARERASQWGAKWLASQSLTETLRQDGFAALSTAVTRDKLLKFAADPDNWLVEYHEDGPVMKGCPDCVGRDRLGRHRIEDCPNRLRLRENITREIFSEEVITAVLNARMEEMFSAAAAGDPNAMFAVEQIFAVVSDDQR